jgi:AcrR family transcriptional regulator
MNTPQVAQPGGPEVMPPYKRRRQERIVAAAIELMAEGGSYESVQIRDVAERSGLALATVYRYFASKELLYAAALYEWCRGFFQGPRARWERDSDTNLKRMRKIMRATIRANEKLPQMVRAWYVLEASTDPGVQGILRELDYEYNLSLESVLRDLNQQARADVVLIVRSVYDRASRNWIKGLCTIREVERATLRGVDLAISAVGDPGQVP